LVSVTCFVNADIHDMFTLSRESCMVSTKCLFSDKSPAGFYDMLMSPCHVYFVKRVLLGSITCLPYADNHLGLHLMFTFKKES
jgi:hypothetical protein